MARRFFRDTRQVDRPGNVGLFRPMRPDGRPDAPDRGPDDAGDRPRPAPPEPADERPLAAADDGGGPPQRAPRWPRGVRPLPSEPAAAPPEPADEPAPPRRDLERIGFLRQVRPTGRPDIGDDGDRRSAAPPEPADEQPPSTAEEHAPPADDGGSPPERGPRWLRGLGILPTEDAAAPPESAPRLQTVGWRSQEYGWLHGRVEELERQLRQRTFALGLSALVATVALAGLAVVLLGEPESPTTAGAPGEPWITTVLPEGLAGGDQQGTATGGADGDAATARAALSAALARIEELEAADQERAATIASLRAELDSTRAEAQTLREHLDVSRQGIERLNALLARATGAAPAAAPPAPAETAPSVPAPAPAETAEAAAPAAAPETAGAQATGGLYVTTGAVNLRAEPSTTARVLVLIGQGELVRGIGGEGEWVQVEHADGSVGVVTGWVHNEFVRPAGASPDAG